MIRTLTHEALSAKPNNPSYVITDEVFRETLDRGIDKVMKEEWAQPFMGEQFIRQVKVKTDHGKFQNVRGYSGVVPLNRDEDTMPVATTGLDFPWTWDTFDFRLAIYVSRKAQELDIGGQTKGTQRDLLDMHRRTVEYIIADVFNRAVGASGAPLLASDGLYLLDSSRPNPNPEAGTWSNLEATADLDEDSLFDASYNASQQVSPDGTLYPQTIKKMVIKPSWEKAMFKVLTADRVLGSNNNDPNWANSAFKMADVISYPYMTTDQILYLLTDPKSEDNQLIMPVRVSPSILTQWAMNGNPDVLGQRIRTSWGLALGSPRRFIRGGLLSAGS